MATDVISLIMDDHRLMEQLFERIQAGEGDRAALIDEVEARLLAHARAEEQEVYPAVAKAVPEEREEVDHGYDEHQETEKLIQKVRERMDAPGFDHALQKFISAMEHHVEEEETEVLPALRETVDEDTLERLGEAFIRVRGEVLREEGFDEPSQSGGRETGGRGHGRRGSGGGATGEAAQPTRAELYERAKQADISGRSQMSKEELERALREKP